MPDYLRLTAAGAWEPSDGPELREGDVTERLNELGWEEFLSLGEMHAGIEIAAYENLGPSTDKNSPYAEYLIIVGSRNIVGVSMLVDGLPNLMDTLAKWAPLVQAATISVIGEELAAGGQPDADGLVETITKKVLATIEAPRGASTRPR